MNVLNVCFGADIGGQSIQAQRAFAVVSDWQYRSCVHKTNYLGYDTDLPWADLPEAWKRADVLHMKNKIRFKVKDHGTLPRKPTVVHYHGSGFREHPGRFLAMQYRRNALGIVSTLDLWLLAKDDTRWMPSPNDLDYYASFARKIDDGVLRIGHAPTDRAIKSTQHFLAACQKLGRETPVEVVLIERAKWTDCLKRKGLCDIYFDQTILGYGQNAIEAWAMGIPVVAGAQDDTLDEMTRRFGSLPFTLADEATIYEALTHLAEPANRLDAVKRGLDHVHTWHSQEAVVPMLQQVYREVAA